MRTQITSAIAMLIAMACTMTAVQAQVVGQFQQPQTQVRTLPAPVQAQPPQQAYVVPGPPTIQPPPPQQNQFYFGVNVQLNRGYQGTTLRITSVTPGSPAQAAGLEIGDEIRTVNGRSFEQARDSFHAVSMMNSFVNYSAPAAPAAAAGVQAYVVPPQPAPQPTAQMLVRNVRNGQNVWVNVYPQQRGGYAPAPAAAPTATTTYTAPAPSYNVPAPTPAVQAPPVYSNPSH